MDRCGEKIKEKNATLFLNSISFSPIENLQVLFSRDSNSRQKQNSLNVRATICYYLPCFMNIHMISMRKPYFLKIIIKRTWTFLVWYFTNSQLLIIIPTTMADMY